MFNIFRSIKKTVLAKLTLTAIFLTGVAGCGTGNPTGKVVGQVVHKGTPITKGDVNLYAKAKGTGALAKIGPNGAFEFPEVLETGTYDVYVTPPALEPQPNAVVRRPATNIPPRWQDPKTSGMKVEVKTGTNEVVIDLAK